MSSKFGNLTKKPGKSPGQRGHNNGVIFMTIDSSGKFEPIKGSSPPLPSKEPPEPPSGKGLQTQQRPDKHLEAISKTISKPEAKLTYRSKTYLTRVLTVIKKAEIPGERTDAINKIRLLSRNRITNNAIQSDQELQKLLSEAKTHLGLGL